MNKKMNSKLFWDNNYSNHKIFGNGYSPWSTFRRFNEISRHIDNSSRVADLFAGAGTLEIMHGPYKYYLACDWSETGLSYARADKKIIYDATIKYDRDDVLKECKNDNIDWIVLCGVFMIGELVEKINVFEFIRECYNTSNKGVIVNFGSDENVYLKPHGRIYKPIKVMKELADLKPSIIQNYLPHEYLAVLEKPKRDWNKK